MKCTWWVSWACCEKIGPPYFGSPCSKILKYLDPGTKMFKIFGSLLKYFIPPPIPFFHTYIKGSKYFTWNNRSLLYSLYMIACMCFWCMQRWLLSTISLHAGGLNISLEIFDQYFTWNIWSPFLNSYPCALATYCYIPTWKTSLYKY